MKERGLTIVCFFGAVDGFWAGFDNFLLLLMYVTQHFGLAMCLSAIYHCQQCFQRQQMDSVQLSRNWKGILGNNM